MDSHVYALAASLKSVPPDPRFDAVRAVARDAALTLDALESGEDVDLDAKAQWLKILLSCLVQLGLTPNALPKNAATGQTATPQESHYEKLKALRGGAS